MNQEKKFAVAKELMDSAIQERDLLVTQLYLKFQLEIPNRITTEEKIAQITEFLDKEIRESDYHDVTIINVIVNLLPWKSSLSWLINTPKFQMMMIRDELEEIKNLDLSEINNLPTLVKMLSNLRQKLNTSTFVLQN